MISTDELLIRILMHEGQSSAWESKLSELGVELGESSNVDLLDIVLEALGFPPDNSGELPYEARGDPTADYFCRDWLTYEFSDQVPNGTHEEAERYLAWLKKELADPAVARWQHGLKPSWGKRTQ